MLSEPSSKYRPFPPVHLPDRQWPGRVLTAAPLWCSVDLRDGNQALREPMSVEQKLKMFHALVKCGFKEIEIGFPAASNTEFAFNRRLIEEGHVPDDVTVQVLVQAREDLIERTVESLIGSRRCVIHLYNSTSPAQRRVVFGKSKQEIVAMAVRGARWIQERLPRLRGTEVVLQYSPESFSLTEVEFAKEISDAVIDVWQPTPERKMILNLPDTVEIAMPNIYADQIEWMCRNVKNRESLIVSLHTHNDRGTGVAATELGLLAGADRVEGTLFGNGERTGNLDIITVALNLYMHGIDPKLRFDNMAELRAIYEECTGMTVPPRNPYSGELVFTAFSGSHQDAIKKGFTEWQKNQGAQHWDVPYLTIDPNDIGREYTEVIRVNSQSGKGGVAFLLENEMGITMPRDLQKEFGIIAQDEMDRVGREVNGKELRTLFEREFFEGSAPWLLVNVKKVTAGEETRAEVSVTEGASARTLHGTGKDATAALSAALQGVLDVGMPPVKIAESRLGSAVSERDGKVLAFARVQFGNDQTAYGAARALPGEHPEYQAAINALNRAYPWSAFERGSGIVLPQRLRLEFGAQARQAMQVQARRFAAADLERLFFSEYVGGTEPLRIVESEFSFSPEGGLWSFHLKGLQGRETVEAKAEGSTMPNAVCAALAKIVGQPMEVVDFAVTKSHPIHDRRGSEDVAFAQLRIGNVLVWGVGLADSGTSATVQAVCTAVNRHVAPRHSEKSLPMSTSIQRKPYPFSDFEPKWQQHWDTDATFHAPNPGEKGFDPKRPKYYVLDMFPYPSGAGLHVGHPEGYTATDIIGRYKWMRGFSVLHPMGWDAFGLPAEQYAIKTGQHPAVTTAQNVAKFKSQLKSIGFGYDWQREVNTTDPGYFKWTQWIFTLLYNSWFNPATNKAEPITTYKGEDADSVRLAYVSEAPVNWCPALGTVLANEEVIDGKSEVGGHPVERRPMKQWMLRITTFAQRLIDELDGLDWPDSIKLLQRNWIGRSEGAEVRFGVEHASAKDGITVFTTRPDTLYGATYMVLAPEHPLVDVITTPENREAVALYRVMTSGKSDLERTELAKEKTGVFTGAFAINPVNGEKIPIWIADYVLTGYGTGAIMAVPAHDERDWEFARKFALPICEVVSAEPRLGLGGGGVCDAEPLEPFCEEGYAIHSGPLDGLPTTAAKAEIIRLLEEKGVGKKRINFKLRDWLFSRQRYWGEPFPIVWEGGQHRTIDASELPLTPPEMEDFKPTGTPEPPLSKAKDWLKYSDKATRETNTMPQWAGSCWYYLRYTDAQNSERFTGVEAEKYWMGGGGAPGTSARPGGVDLYVGGTEHAVLHLLYARFWHKVLFDLGYVSTPEPFQKLVNQGLILGETEFSLFTHPDGTPCSAADVKNVDEEATAAGPRLFGTHRTTNEKITARSITADTVEKVGDGFGLKSDHSIRVDARSFKMSKSRGNVVNPDDVVSAYGADALRCYEMFMGPLEATKPWAMAGVEGISRFLARVWRLVMEDANDEGAWRLHPAVQDIEPTKEQLKVVHATIKKVGEDIEALSFNTAIAQMMVCTNAFVSATPRPRSCILTLLHVLNPFAPHITEELWQRLGGEGTLAHRPWPAYDPAVLIEDEIEIPVQVNGKLRDKIVVKKDATKEDIEKAALACPKVAEQTAGKDVKKIVVVPGRLVNIVVA